MSWILLVILVVSGAPQVKYSEVRTVDECLGNSSEIRKQPNVVYTLCVPIPKEA